RRRTDGDPAASPTAKPPRENHCEQRTVIMGNAVILTGPGFQDHDVVYTYYRLLEEGWKADVATKNGDPVTGKYGVPLPIDKTARPNISFEDLDVDGYDAAICTGGHEAPDRVRQDRRVLSFVGVVPVE